MAEYQNIFTRVQVRGPVYPGMPLPAGDEARIVKPFFTPCSAGSAIPQIGPIYIGRLGLRRRSSSSSPSRSSA